MISVAESLEIINAEILCFGLPVAAYLLGAVPFGLIFSRLFAKRDPREYGSGNIGATNVLRASGKKVGILTLAADVGKGALPVAVAMQFDGEKGDGMLVAVVALAAFLGHIFPVYLSFKGGKGVATMFGVLIPWMPFCALIAFLTWLVTLVLWRYVSLSSVLAGLTLPVSFWFFEQSTIAIGVALLLALFIAVRHVGNLQRIRSGEEDKVGES